MILHLLIHSSNPDHSQGGPRLNPGSQVSTCDCHMGDQGPSTLSHAQPPRQGLPSHRRPGTPSRTPATTPRLALIRGDQAPQAGPQLPRQGSLGHSQWDPSYHAKARPNHRRPGTPSGTPATAPRLAQASPVGPQPTRQGSPWLQETRHPEWDPSRHAKARPVTGDQAPRAGPQPPCQGLLGHPKRDPSRHAKARPRHSRIFPLFGNGTYQ